MRMSILITATTEQMGYGMVSFFVCFLLMNRNPFQNFTLVFYEEAFQLRSGEASTTSDDVNL